MALKHIVLATGLVALTATSAQAGEPVEIRNFVGKITWSNGSLDADIVENAGDTTISTRDGLVIDGGIEKIDNDACKGSYAKWSWDWNNKTREGSSGGYKNLEDYPVLELTLPKNTDLRIRNAVIFATGAPNIGSADLALDHCGDLSLGTIDGPLVLISRGSADLDFVQAETLDLQIRGSGDVTGDAVIGAVNLDSRGSGDVELGQTGPLMADLRGSGDLEVDEVSGDVASGARGSGDIDLGEITGNIVFISRGSGDFETDDVTSEEVDIETYGSSSVRIEDGQIARLTATSRGSGGIEIDATITDAVLRAAGSGDIDVERVTGTAESRISGSGEIEIDRRD